MRSTWLGRLLGLAILGILLWILYLLFSGGDFAQLITAISTFVLLVGVYALVLRGRDRGGP